MTTCLCKEDIVLPANILWLGATNSGKTYAFREYYKKYWKHQMRLTYVISPTAIYSDDFKGIIPDKYILSDMTLAKSKIQEIAEFCKTQKLKDKNYPVMLVIDDGLGVVNFNEAYFCNLIAMSRHINLTIVIMMQNLTKYLSPALRNNLGYIFTSKIADANLKCLYELAGCWESYNDMKLYLKANLVNYQQVLIDKKNINNPQPKCIKLR